MLPRGWAGAATRSACNPALHRIASPPPAPLLPACCPAVRRQQSCSGASASGSVCGWWAGCSRMCTRRQTAPLLRASGTPPLTLLCLQHRRSMAATWPRHDRSMHFAPLVVVPTAGVPACRTDVCDDIELMEAPVAAAPPPSAAPAATAAAAAAPAAAAMAGAAASPGESSSAVQDAAPAPGQRCYEMPAAVEQRVVLVQCEAGLLQLEQARRARELVEDRREGVAAAHRGGGSVAASAPCASAPHRR